MAAAVPFAIKAAPYAAAGLGALFGHKASKPNAQQQAGIDSTTNLATKVLPQTGAALTAEGAATRATGAGQVNTGLGYVGNAADYYKNILGSRSSTEAALAPERSQALDYYGGAARKATRTLRGPVRDTAVADLDRQKVWQLADMTGRARTGAAGALGTLGSQYAQAGNAQQQVGANLTGMGVNAQSNALYGSQALFNQGQTLRQNANDTGNTTGKFIFDIMQSMPWAKGGGGGGADLPKYGPAF